MKLKIYGFMIYLYKIVTANAYMIIKYFKYF